MIEYYLKIPGCCLSGHINNCDILTSTRGFLDLIAQILVFAIVRSEAHQGIDQLAILRIHILLNGHQGVSFKPGDDPTDFPFRGLEPDAAEIVKIVGLEFLSGDKRFGDP